MRRTTLTAPKVWILGSAVLSLLLIVVVGLTYRTVPPGIGPTTCLLPAPPDERPNDPFARMGGHSTRDPNIRWRNGVYTIDDVAQGRNLERYDRLVLKDPEPKAVVERWHDPMLAQARTFLWTHWQQRKRGYLILTRSSVDHMSTSHIFVEPDDIGRWRVYWRSIDRREVTDLPTDYSMRWALTGGWDKPGTSLAEGQLPDPVEDRLELRDVCREWDGSF